VLGALTELLFDTDVLARAICRAEAQSGSREAGASAEIKSLDSKRPQLLAALDRYFAAFEAGRLPEDLLAPRVQRLHDELQQLEARRSALELELSMAVAHTPVAPAQLARDLLDVLAAAEPPQLKPLLQALVARIEVESRDAVQPTFRIPTDTRAVRIVDGLVGRTSRNANPSLVFEAQLITL
jgi:hypothetical protein